MEMDNAKKYPLPSLVLLLLSMVWPLQKVSEYKPKKDSNCLFVCLFGFYGISTFVGY